MRKPVVTAAMFVAAVAALAGCRDSSEPRTVSRFVASLPASAPDNPAGPFLVGDVPTGHATDAVVRGTDPVPAASDWCVGKVCASGAFAAWRSLAWPGLGPGFYDRWPKGSYFAEFGAPAPRVNDDRNYLLPTGSAIDVAMLPGSRADLALGATYNVMGEDAGQETPNDVWFERRLVRVNGKSAILTESYGSDDKFPRDTKTLYFEGPHGELGVVRATSNIFFGSDIWDRGDGGTAARVRRSKQQAERQQVSDDELVRLAASVRRASAAEFADAAQRVADGRICSFDATQGPCAAGSGAQADWGDWQRSSKHPVYFEFLGGGQDRLFALAPDVTALRYTTLTRGGKEVAAGTVAASAAVDGVRWARARVQARRVTALDAGGHELETVRVDLAGP